MQKTLASDGDVPKVLSMALISPSDSVETTLLVTFGGFKSLAALPWLSPAIQANSKERTCKAKDERSFLYLLFSLATGILYFTWVVTGISLSASLIILIIGLPFTGVFILSVRGIGLVEGRIVEALLGIRMPHRSQFHQRNMGLWSRFKNIIFDKYTWFSIVYMIIQLPLGTLYFSVFITLIALSLYGIVMPILQLGYDIPVNINNASYYLDGWMLFLVVIAGILLATVTMHVAKYVGQVHGALAKALLVRS